MPSRLQAGLTPVLPLTKSIKIIAALTRIFVNEASRPPSTPVHPSATCEAIWQICNLPSSSYVWRFTNWDGSAFDEPTTANQSPMFRVPCGGRNTFKSVCVRAVNTIEWYCINY
jgi:hypothetical protein